MGNVCLFFLRRLLLFGQQGYNSTFLFGLKVGVGAGLFSRQLDAHHLRQSVLVAGFLWATFVFFFLGVFFFLVGRVTTVHFFLVSKSGSGPDSFPDNWMPIICVRVFWLQVFIIVMHCLTSVITVLYSFFVLSFLEPIV